VYAYGFIYLDVLNRIEVSFYLHTSTYCLLYAYHLKRFCRFILLGFHWELLQGEGSLEALIHSISLTLLLFIYIAAHTFHFQLAYNV
jgi:hypothetical protein